MKDKKLPDWTIHVPNGLSLLRALCVFPVLIFSLWAALADPWMWVWAFVWLAFGWLTDPLDGWVARRWGSPTFAWKKWERAGGDRQSFVEWYRIGNKIWDFSFRISANDPDGTADTILAFGSSLVPIVYIWATAPNAWVLAVAMILAVLYLASIVMGIVMMILIGRDSENRRTKSVVWINMAVFHGLLQIGLTPMWFAYMAAGWWLVVPMLIILAVVGWLQRGKIALWRSGRLAQDED